MSGIYMPREKGYEKALSTFDEATPRASEPPQDNTVPFGKYRGMPIGALLADAQYVAWCKTQGLDQKYPQVFANNINIYNLGQGQEPADTPEHNALQLRFLDDAFIDKVATAYGFTKKPTASWYLDKTNADAQKAFQEASWDFCSSDRSAEFEVHGFDVIVTGKWQYTSTILGERYTERFWLKGQSSMCRANLLIELKTSMGADYPAVLRQIKQAWERYVRNSGVHYKYVQEVVNTGGPLVCIIDNFTGTVPYDQVKKLFERSGVALLTLAEVLAAELPTSIT